MRVREAEWSYRLSPAEVAEIEAALKSVQARGLDIAEICREDFPLPTLGPVLDRLRAEVLDGRGFVLLRGVPVEGRPIAESATAYWGIGTLFRQCAIAECARASARARLRSRRQQRDRSAPSAPMRRRNARTSTSIAAMSSHCCACGAPSRAGCRRSSARWRCTMSCWRAGPICWSDCTSRSPSTGAARCRRARRRSTTHRCSTSMPATSRCCIRGCISVRRSGFPRRGGWRPRISRRSICWRTWRAIRSCGST